MDKMNSVAIPSMELTLAVESFAIKAGSLTGLSDLSNEGSVSEDWAKGIAVGIDYAIQELGASLVANQCGALAGLLRTTFEIEKGKRGVAVTE